MDVAPLDLPVLGDLSVTARALLAASGAEWRFSVEGPWALATPVGARSPEQGWKLHVSATEAAGVAAPLTRAPGGPPLPAGRPAPSGAPSGRADPSQPGAAPPSATSTATPGATVLLNGRYSVQGALSHANKGGTYLAEDATTGQLVVVKEGRPHVGDEGHGDARARVRHEARMLAHVEGLDRAPRLIEVFEQSEHVFLVEEYIDAPSLREVVEEAGGDGPAAVLPAGELRVLAPP